MTPTETIRFAVTVVAVPAFTFVLSTCERYHALVIHPH
jgi:hypothetical protein